MSQNEAKMAWNPAPVLLRCPILKTSSKKAGMANPTDTPSWHVTYLNMTACRNKYISTSQQKNTKYGSHLYVCNSSNLNNIKNWLLHCYFDSILQCLFNTCCHTERLSAPRNHTLFLLSITAVLSVMLWILFPMLLPAFRMKVPSV